MGFLSLYSGTVRIDLTKQNDLDGYWWVEVKRTLSGAELDIAEGKKLQMTATATDDAKAAKAARERARREMMGQAVEPEQSSGTSTNVRIDTAAYRLELLTLAITDWNLTDEADMPLPLAPFDAKRRSIRLLPPGVYDMIVASVEQNAEKSKSTTKDEREDFREDRE